MAGAPHDQLQLHAYLGGLHESVLHVFRAFPELRELHERLAPLCQHKKQKVMTIA